MRKWLVLIAVVAGLTMDLMDLTIVNVAVPDIMTKFGSDMRITQYVITAYMITIGLFEPTTAFLADTRGIKRVYLWSLAVFTAGSVMCALAWNIDSLIAFRIVQAIGGGMIMPLAMSIVQQTFSKEELPLAMGLMGIPMLIAPALGPTIGGYFVQFWSWRLIFWINVPIGIFAILSSSALLKDFETAPKKLDAWGFLLSAVGFSSLLIAISNGPADGWRSLSILSLFAVSALSLLVFVIVELRSSFPLLDMNVFKSRIFNASSLVTFFMMMGMFGSLFLVPLFLQDLRGLAAMNTGMILIPEVVGAALFIPVSALLLPRVGATFLTILGLAIMTIGMFPLMNLQLETAITSLELHLFLVGGGLGFGIMPAMTVAYQTLPKLLVNQGSAFLNMMRQIGSAVGVAILTTVIQERTPVHLARLAEVYTPQSQAGQFLLQLEQHLQSAGYGLNQAQQIAAGYIQQFVQQGAAVLAFHDAFLTSILFGICSVLPALFLYRGKSAPTEEPTPVQSSIQL